MEVKFPALLGNYVSQTDRTINRHTGQRTDRPGHRDVTSNKTSDDKTLDMKSFKTFFT